MNEPSVPVSVIEHYIESPSCPNHIRHKLAAEIRDARENWEPESYAIQSNTLSDAALSDLLDRVGNDTVVETENVEFISEIFDKLERLNDNITHNYPMSSANIRAINGTSEIMAYIGEYLDE